MHPRGQRMERPGFDRDEIDVRRQLRPIEVLAARAVEHHRTTDRDLDRVVRRAHFGRGDLQRERGDARRLLIDRDFQNGKPRSVLVDHRAQRALPAIDVGLRVGRGNRQPHRRVARGQHGQPRVERLVGRKRGRAHAHGDRKRRLARAIERHQRRARRIVGDRHVRERGTVGTRRRRDAGKEHRRERQRDKNPGDHDNLKSPMRPNVAPASTSRRRSPNPLSRK